MQYIAYFEDEEGCVFSRFVGMHESENSAMGQARAEARELEARVIRVEIA